MIVISKITSGDSIMINELPGSRIYEALPRVARQKTLDGGVVIDNQGFVAGDMTLSIFCELSEVDEASLRSLVESETLIHISTNYGFFTAAIENYTNDNGAVEMSVLLKEAA